MHESLYYATFKGPDERAVVGEGREARGYSAGQTVQIGQADADAIAAQDSFEFDVQQVPEEIIGTAEEAHPNDPTAAQERNIMLADLEA